MNRAMKRIEKKIRFRDDVAVFVVVLVTQAEQKYGKKLNKLLFCV
jgi:hypothetical protein